MNPEPPISKADLGRPVTLEGWAADAKSGALLVGDGFTIFIDKLDSWPPGYYSGGQKGQRVRVKGILGQAYDLPVFVQPKDGLQRTGMPVPEGTDLRSASHRFVIKEAKWELLE